jgi:glycosyltransferase involved in cell wall biosynthesis
MQSITTASSLHLSGNNPLASARITTGIVIGALSTSRRKISSRYVLVLAAILANVSFLFYTVGSEATSTIPLLLVRLSAAARRAAENRYGRGPPEPPFSPLVERNLEDVFDMDFALDPNDQIKALLERPLRVAIVTHEMARSGAAMMCLELASMLHRRGANVSIVVLYSKQPGLAREHSLRILPDHPFRVSEDGAELFKGAYSAQKYDLIVASSAAAATVNWVSRFRKRNKDFGRLLWWVHEGPAVMQEFPARFADEAVEAMKLGHADGLIFESWHSASWWLQRIADVSRTRMVAPFSRVVHWGLPQFKLDSIAAAATRTRRFLADTGGKKAPSVAWPRVLRERLAADGARVRVFIMVANGNPRKGHEAAFEAIRLASESCGEGAGGPRLRLLGVGVTPLTSGRASSEDLYPLSARYAPLVELMKEKVRERIGSCDVIIMMARPGRKTYTSESALNLCFFCIQPGRPPPAARCFRRVHLQRHRWRGELRAVADGGDGCRRAGSRYESGRGD